MDGCHASTEESLPKVSFVCNLLRIPTLRRLSLEHNLCDISFSAEACQKASLLKQKFRKGNVFCSLLYRRGSQQDILNVMGALYATVLFLGFNNASTVQPVVAVERSVFYREKAAGLYHPLPYSLAQVRTGF